jgi:hypothetical protein
MCKKKAFQSNQTASAAPGSSSGLRLLLFVNGTCFEVVWITGNMAKCLPMCLEPSFEQNFMQTLRSCCNYLHPDLTIRLCLLGAPRHFSKKPTHVLQFSFSKEHTNQVRINADVTLIRHRPTTLPPLLDLFPRALPTWRRPFCFLGSPYLHPRGPCDCSLFS